MIHKANMPKAEAIVQVRGLQSTWVDFVDIDPIMIPVEDFAAPGIPALTDVFDPGLMRVVDVLVEIANPVEYRLVWSATDHPVKGCCPGCDDVFIVSEGFVGDVDNEGYEAVGCGCYDG
jgi:hypothetical protein